MELAEQAFTFLIAYALILTLTYVVDARESIARQMTETARLNEERQVIVGHIGVVEPLNVERSVGDRCGDGAAAVAIRAQRELIIADEDQSERRG